LNNTFSHIRTNLFSILSFSSFLFTKHKIFLSLLGTPPRPLLEIVHLVQWKLEILPSNQWPPHPSWTNENREWFSHLWKLGWESLCPMKHEGGSIL
jgi:hypothetical protein